jgi:dTDP-4-dehydrorhamnose reductase
MKWLITGSNGQLGSCLQDYLTQKGDSFLAVDFNELDITDAGSVQRVLSDYQPDVVVNAAAYTAVDKAETEEEKAFAVNVTGPRNLAAWCEIAGIWFVHVSTDYVFAGDANVAYCESDPVAPKSVYGRTKLQGEQAVAESCSRYLTLRTAWVFSEYGNNFVKTMLRLARERSELGVVADQFGCPTYAGDIAAAIVSMVEQAMVARLQAGIYHYTGDVAVSWWSFAREVHLQAVALGLLERAPRLKAISTADYPTPAARPAFSVLDCSRVLAAGIPCSDWERAVKRVLPLI